MSRARLSIALAATLGAGLASYFGVVRPKTTSSTPTVTPSAIIEQCFASAPSHDTCAVFNSTDIFLGRVLASRVADELSTPFGGRDVYYTVEVISSFAGNATGIVLVHQQGSFDVVPGTPTAQPRYFLAPGNEALFITNYSDNRYILFQGHHSYVRVPDEAARATEVVRLTTFVTTPTP